MNIATLYKKDIFSIFMALILGFGAPFFLDSVNAILLTENLLLKKNIDEFQKEIDKTKLSQNLLNTAPQNLSLEEKEHLLIKPNRPAVLKLIENSSIGYDINSLTLILSPEMPAEENRGASDITSSTITLSGGAPNDIFARNFINKTLSLLPGRAQITALLFSRENKTTLDRNNLHFDVTLYWLANKSEQGITP